MEVGSGRKALFLDRDGVICRALPPKQYLLCKEQVSLVPGIGDVIRHARERGYLIVVVTNQPQVAYGMLDLRSLERIHAHMHALLDGSIDAIYTCPHQDQDSCECRKPRPGLLRMAIRDFGIDPSRSLLIGDRTVDILAAQDAGCEALLLRNEFSWGAASHCPPANEITSLYEALPYLT